MIEDVTNTPKEPWNLDQWFEDMKKDPNWGEYFNKLSENKRGFLQTAARLMYQDPVQGAIKVLDEIGDMEKHATPEDKTAYEKYRSDDEAVQNQYGVNYYSNPEAWQKIKLENYLSETSLLYQTHVLTVLIMGGPLSTFVQSARGKKE